MGVPYELEERTYLFAKSVRAFIRQLPRTESHRCDVPQLIRSSGSVPANYIEANESLGKKDFLMHIKISRKEAKESVLWLRLLEPANEHLEIRRNELIQEATELMNIFGAIFRRSQGK